ncbi:MAG: PAS domain S-box protein, partial [Planctomycetes bacterium]|nr:PAS domain S-box protein [Planctomycetota bacterium]
MDTATIKVDPAFSALTLDIVTNILAMAATPSELGKYLTEEMRELTGARTVIVLQCLHQAGAVDDRIVSINPQRRQGLTESPRFARLVEIAHDLNCTTWWHSGEDSGEAEDILTTLDAGLSIHVPLNVGEFREGTILLLDLPERRHIESVINMLEMLSPVVALILRNSFLYTQQKNIIADRTRQLQQSEHRYRSLVENVDFGVSLIDTDFNVLFANTAMGDLFGKPPGEFVGKKCFHEYEKRQEVCPHCPGAKAMATDKPALAETSGVRDDGSRFAVRNQAFPLFGSDGSSTGFIEVVEDFTKIKQAQEDIRKFKTISDNASYGTVITDMDGKIVYIN